MPTVEATARLLPDCELQELSGLPPHESWQDWRELLTTLSVLDQADDVLVMEHQDMAYVVFPSGTVYCTTPIRSLDVLEDVRLAGAISTLQQIKDGRLRIKQALQRIDAPDDLP